MAAFSAPVCGHMNADHGDDMAAMLRHYVGIRTEAATMLCLDRLGMDMEVRTGGVEGGDVRAAERVLGG